MRELFWAAVSVLRSRFFCSFLAEKSSAQAGPHCGRLVVVGSSHIQSRLTYTRNA